MNIDRLQALIEFDDGEFHFLQSARYNSTYGKGKHARMSEAQDWLLEHGFLELVGEDFLLTAAGKDVLEMAAHSAKEEAAR